MQTEFITPIYAAVIALAFVFLSVRTLRLRHRYSVAIGSGEQPLLARAARAHANYAEYVPFALLLIYFLELSIGPGLRIHALCALLVVGRLVHAFGISQVEENFRYRVVGMVLTFTVIISASLSILGVAIV